MLCDDIINSNTLPTLYSGFGAAQSLINGASKFVLAPDFTAAADGLVNNFKELARIAPFCRLPAPVCWFELAQADRPQFCTSPMHFEEFQFKPHRVGFLCIATDPEKLWSWSTILCWSLKEAHFHDLNASQIMVDFDTRDGFGDTDPLARYVQIHTAPFCLPEIRKEVENSFSAIHRIMSADWGGEIRYLLAMLGLFNARNVMEVERIDKTKHNKKRIKDRKPPFCNHTLLKIRAMHRRSLIGAKGAGTSADIREHFVSGHWKARRTGLFWWNPFWRGNPERGSVSHDYQVNL